MGQTPDYLIKKRLLARTSKTLSCWLWIGSRNNKGYGTINIDRVPQYVHRVSWRLHYGIIPEGLFVLHRCDNTLCLNPEHLFLGTQLNNMQDCRDKGRINAKITLEEADHIRREFLVRSGEGTNRNGEPKMRLYAEFANRYRVSTKTIQHILYDGRRMYGAG